MDRKSLIDWFSSVEEDLEYKTNLIDIWPILKSDLFFYWYNSASTRPNGRESISILKRVIRVISFFVKVMFIGKNRNVLYSGFSAHRVEIRSEEHTSELQSRENLVCR